MLPEWDRKFVVVHAGEPFPTEWNACVLLADPDAEPSRQQEIIDALRVGWRGFGRLVVLVPQQADGSPLSQEHAVWAGRALAWADEIIARVPATGPLPPRLLADRDATPATPSAG